MERRQTLYDAAAGLLAGLLFLSYLLSFVFLAPVQYAYSGRGMKSGVAASLAALLVIVFGQIFRMMELGAVQAVSVLTAVIPPLAALCALAIINVPRWRMKAGYRLVLVSAIVSAAAYPFIWNVTGDDQLLSWLASAVAQTAGVSTLDGDGLSVAREAVSAAAEMIRFGFSAFILAMFGMSWWLGTRARARNQARLGIEGALERLESLKLASVRVPPIFLWPTLASWALLFAAIVASADGLLLSVAWNIALFAAVIYSAQGFGILSHLAGATRAAPFLRLMLPIVLLGVALSSTMGTVAMIVLPILGITEVWLPYRSLKGAMK